MARLARLVVPGLPHHVTQRGNGGARTFFSEGDYAYYRDLLAQYCAEASVEVWAWVLMPNHVHLILNPSDPDGLRRALSAAHRKYAGYVHARLEKTGHFWQGRFGAVVMDEAHLAAAIRYVALNPVRARLHYGDTIRNSPFSREAGQLREASGCPARTSPENSTFISDNRKYMLALESIADQAFHSTLGESYKISNKSKMRLENL